jgi:hypothetical protein
MFFWQILGRFAVSDKGETLQKISDTTSVASDGTTYTRMGSTTVGSDESVPDRSSTTPRLLRLKNQGPFCAAPWLLRVCSFA